MKKDTRRLRLGLPGRGEISQAAHLDAIRNAHNADLYAICDIAEDLTDRRGARMGRGSEGSFHPWGWPGGGSITGGDRGVEAKEHIARRRPRSRQPVPTEGEGP
jgi:hypothetical protein